MKTITVYGSPLTAKGSPTGARTLAAGLPWRGAIRLTADRVVPASFFGLMLAAKALSRPASLSQLGVADGTVKWKLVAEATGYGLGCVFLAVMISLYMMRRPSIRKEMGILQRSVALGATLVMFATALVPIEAPSVSVALAANLLIVVGLCVTLWGLAGLRRFFGILPEVRGLVTGGPYRHMRHPMYVGESISSLGVTLLALSPITAAVFTAFLVLQWRRALYEEALLCDTLPEYREYCARTRRFLPCLW